MVDENNTGGCTTGGRSTGGCQCGAVRYRVDGPLGGAGICHCRMCQKASGNFAMPLVSAPIEQVTWTRGRPSEFASTELTVRGFCSACGTPLYLSEAALGTYELTIGSLDDPNIAPPTHAVGIESKLNWADGLADLPSRTTREDRTPEELAQFISKQHPDHDT